MDVERCREQRLFAVSQCRSVGYATRLLDSGLPLRDSRAVRKIVVAYRVVAESCFMNCC